MAIKKILTYPNPVLRQKVETVTNFDDSLKELADDLAETMYAAPGAGLAANQIGVCLRVVVVDVSASKEDKKHLVLVNPEIIEKEGCQVDEEGCLSVIDLTANVERYRKLLVRAQDLDGKSWEFPAEDFFARVIQHELDHLNGILFIDHLSSLKRSLYKKRLKKILRKQEEGSS
jgi:peptide deformylase